MATQSSVRLPGPTVGDIGERAVIERIRARVPQPPPWLSIGIGDDAAVLQPARQRAEVVTTDALVEGVHFDRASAPPAAIGHKALAVNLSDLAAMGAEPRAAVLSLVLPASLLVSDLDAIVEGWLGLAGRYRVVLVGGNITRSPGPLMVDVTALGSVKPRRVLSRRGARAGDDIYVSGEVGAAYAGFLKLAAARTPAATADDASEPSDDGVGMERCVERFLTPDPRVRLGQLLGRNGVASSCVDTSDGLGDAVHQMAEANQVGAIIEADALPVPPAARRWLAGREGLDPVAAAISGGEDYELLFTVPRRRRRAMEAIRRQAGNPVCTRIGRVTVDRQVLLRRPDGTTRLPGGFVHFR